LGVTEDINEDLNENEKSKYRKKLNVLARNSRKLLQLINQILDLSKIENKKLVLKITCSDIVHFLKITTESFHSLARHKNIEFVFYNEIESLCMDFDREKFLIVISNLLSNAIKFTSDYGKIILHVKKEKDISGKECLIIKVKDTGIGIDTDDLENVFDRFFQAKNSNADIAEGTGIGLAIVKEYIHLMNGNIRVESSVGKGTVFTLMLPISCKAKRGKGEMILENERSPKEIDSEQEPSVDLNSPLLLIVEDNYDVANYIASFVDTQYQIIFAKDGEEGVSKAVKYIPDIIITDLMMPKKNGFELCNILKNDPITSHIPIIMLTARSLEQDKLKGYSVGADAYLIKPFNKKELLIRIRQLTELRKKLQEKYSNSALLLEKPVNFEDAFLNRLFSFLDNNLGNPDYKSVNLASEMGFSDSQLYRKIKALTNNSTALFIRNYRLEKAKDMLLNTELNVSEIAYKCGFNDPAWFAHSFKEKYKTSPSGLRK
jgi:DNA-binding response OmpR family regulator/two-component sensor histidine kinase